MLFTHFGVTTGITQVWFEQFNEIFFFALAQGLIIRSNFIERSNLKWHILLLAHLAMC